MSNLKPYLALAGLALIWGASFLLIKVAVHDMSPTVLLLIRSLSGLIALSVIVKLMGRPLLGEGWKTRLGSFAIMAVTNAIVPWVAIAWGEERISSGLASILNSTTTLWTAVLIFWAMPKERPSGVGYLGVLIGLAGVVEDPTASELLIAFANTPDREAGSIASTARSSLSLWTDERVAAATRERGIYP